MAVERNWPRVTLVVPAKNEVKNIGTVLSRVPDEVDEVILVDAHSADGTVELARQLRPDVVVVYDDEPGKGAALRAGFRQASGDYVAIIDADGSMDPQELTRYFTHLSTGYELVKGSRFMTGGLSTDITFIRRFGNRVLTVLSNVMFRQKFTDLCYGYLAFDRVRMQELGLESTGFEIEAEIVAKAAMNGLHITEVPTYETPRLHGDSNLHAIRDGLRILRTLLQERARGRRVRTPEPTPIAVADYVDVHDPDNVMVTTSPNGARQKVGTLLETKDGVEGTVG